MARLRQISSALMLVSGVTHLAHFLFSDLSTVNLQIAAVFGGCYLVIGVLLLRASSLGLWLGAIVPGIGGVLDGLVALGNPEPLAVFHTVIDWVVFPRRIYLLVAGTRIAVWAAAPVLLAACFGIYRLLAPILRDPLAPVYSENCAVCHGENLEGTTLGPPLVGHDLRHGDAVAAIAKSVSEGFPASQLPMPAWSQTLDAGQIRGLAILITEKRASFSRTDFKVDAPLVIPAGPIESERHRFRIESVASGLHPLSYAIAPLPDGRILLTRRCAASASSRRTARSRR